MRNARSTAPLLTLFAAVALMLSICTGTAANLLQNGDFNTAPLSANWTFWTSGGGWWGQVTAPDGELYALNDGTPCVKFGGSANSGGSGIYQVISGQPGVPYTLSCASTVQPWWWPAAEMKLIFLNASDAVLLTVTTNCASAITAFDTGLPWSNYVITATSPAG
ncbi:MAG TPA: hypothetical protein VK327_01105, partial [Candidatus Paceibacterota bacterium]|nr:hypothetical protein [Candidatus Paceibacterota bacterium]